MSTWWSKKCWSEWSSVLVDSFNQSDLLVPKAAAGSEHCACLREASVLGDGNFPLRVLVTLTVTVK